LGNLPSPRQRPQGALVLSPPIPGLSLAPQDLSFLLAQLRLPDNRPLQPLEPTGLRDVQGLANNLANPTWGAADQPFVRETYNAFGFQRSLAEATVLHSSRPALPFPLWTQLRNGVLSRGWGNQGP
jgi:hypothetical protein